VTDRPRRRFPPPWTVEEANNACFIIRDANGQALAYVYFKDETDRLSIGSAPLAALTVVSAVARA
jgi:hypothetical protein